MKKKILYVLLFALLISVLSILVYRPEKFLGFVCIKSPCPNMIPAGRGFPFRYWIEGHSWVREEDLGSEIPLKLNLGQFQPISFIANVVVYTFVFVCMYFAYSKLFKKGKKK